MTGVKYYYWNGGWQSLGVDAKLTYWDEVLADSPLALWKLDEASGTDMLDSSGNGRDGTYSGVTLGQTSIIPEVDDTCASFDGTDDYSVLASAAWMNVTAITVEIVVRYDSVVGENGIMGRWGNSDAERSWGLGSNGSTLYWWAQNDSDTYADTSTTVAADTTYHLAGVFDGTEMIFYVNGSEVGTPGSLTGDLDSITFPLEIGQYNESATKSFDGKMQGAAVYDTALSAARILAHAQAAGLA